MEFLENEQDDEMMMESDSDLSNDEAMSVISIEDFDLNGPDEDQYADDDIMLCLDTCSVVLALIATDLSFSSISPLPGRAGNEIRDRGAAITECRSWDDDMFKRQFRMTRRAFNTLIEKVAPRSI